MFRTVLSLIGLIVSVLGFAIFVGVIAGSWWAKDKADRKTDELAEKAESAARVADRTIDLVNNVIDRSEQDLAVAKASPAEDPAVNPFVRLTVNKAAGELPGGVDRAREAVSMASDAVIVLDAALGVFADRPEDQAALGIPLSELETAKQQLNTTAAELRKARSIFGVRLAPLRPDEIDAVQNALEHTRRFIADLKRVLDNARQQVEDTRQKAHRWTLRIALAATGLGSLAALGQVFMARACWRGLFAPPGGATRA